MLLVVDGLMGCALQIGVAISSEDRAPQEDCIDDGIGGVTDCDSRGTSC
jgi:hypothetical protein